MKNNTEIVIHEMQSTTKASDGMTDWTMGKTFKGEGSVGGFGGGRMGGNPMAETGYVSRNSICELGEVPDLREEIVQNEPCA
jgi:hypothetical protein